MWLLVEVSQHRHVLSAVFQMGEKRWSVLRSRLHGSGCCSSMEPGCRQIALRAEFFLASGRDCDRPYSTPELRILVCGDPPHRNRLARERAWQVPSYQLRLGRSMRGTSWNYISRCAVALTAYGVSRDTGDWSDDRASQGYSVPECHGGFLNCHSVHLRSVSGST